MFILDIEPFFHQTVRAPDAVALMRSFGHRQIKPTSGEGQSISEFTQQSSIAFAVRQR
jgi:hypothetical protein